MASPIERLQTLDNIEKDVANSLQHAGQACSELSRDKPANKQVESHIQQFLKTLSSVETELSKQINYLTQVSTGQAHEGSSYKNQKALQMSWQRLEHIRSEVNEMDKLKNHAVVRKLQQQILQQPPPPTQQFQMSHQTHSNHLQQTSNT